MRKYFLASLLMMISAETWATCASVPNSFVNATVADATQVNANFTAVVNCVNAINAAQITAGVLAVAQGGTGTSTWTGGSVAFAVSSSALGQDNPNFFWDSTNHRLGIGTASPANAIDVLSTAGIRVSGNTGDEQIIINNTSAAGHSWRLISSGTGSGDPAASFAIQDITAGGAGALLLGVNAATNVSVTGILQIAQLPFGAFTGGANGYMNHYDGSGNAAILLGGSLDPTNYYRNTTHLFQSIVGGTSFMTLTSGGLNLQSGTYQVSGTQIAASNLGNGTTGTGAIVLAGGTPTFTNRVAIVGNGLLSTSNVLFVEDNAFTVLEPLVAANFSVGSTTTAGSVTACWVANQYVSGEVGITACASDARLKNVFAPIAHGSSAVNSYKPVNYNWKSDQTGAMHVGFVAQDVLTVTPECVSQNQDGMYSIETNCILAYVVNAVQEINTRVSAIESR